MVWIVFAESYFLSLDRLSWLLDSSTAVFVHTKGFIIINGELERNMEQLFYAIVAFKPVARQRPRNKQLCNRRC
jgi:hypothetical protein